MKTIFKRSTASVGQEAAPESSISLSETFRMFTEDWMELQEARAQSNTDTLRELGASTLHLAYKESEAPKPTE